MARWTEFPGPYKIEVNDSDTCIGIDFGPDNTKVTLHRKDDSIAMIMVTPGTNGRESDVFTRDVSLSNIVEVLG